MGSLGPGRGYGSRSEVNMVGAGRDGQIRADVVPRVMLEEVEEAAISAMSDRHPLTMCEVPDNM